VKLVEWKEKKVEKMRASQICQPFNSKKFGVWIYALPFWDMSIQHRSHLE
jgi:hypothetical protein